MCNTFHLPIDTNTDQYIPYIPIHTNTFNTGQYRWIYINTIQYIPICTLHIVKDILATWWGVHADPRPSHAATFAHLYQRISAAKFFSVAFTSLPSCRLIQAVQSVLMQPHSRHTYVAALTPPHSSCHAHTALTLQHSCRRRICAAALAQPHFCRSIHAASCTEPHLCSSSHAPAFTPQHSFAALTPQHWCRLIHAAASTEPHLCRRLHAAAPLSRCSIMASIDTVVLTPQHWCCRFDAAAFIQHLARRRIFRSQHLARISRCSIQPSHLHCRSRTVAFSRYLKRGVLGWGGEGGWRGSGWRGAKLSYYTIAIISGHVPGQHVWASPGPGSHSKCSKREKVWWSF